MPFESILAECVFCGNAMLTVNNSTPYNAVYGRVPHILPGISQIVHPGDAREQTPGTIAHAHRLREISVQAMVEKVEREGHTQLTARAGGRVVLKLVSN